MERLESKKINGQTYYYYSVWGWIKGKCRRRFQKYLGKPADIYKAMYKPAIPLHAEVFSFGLPIVLWSELKGQDIIGIIDKLCPKRAQGMTIGKYLGIAAVNRATESASKSGMWDWFRQTSLYRVLPEANRDTLLSQRFWDHMDAVSINDAETIWKSIIGMCLKRESIKLEEICYDGTNFYTFIDTFNNSCSLAKRGKNKQGRNNLRQVSYALFCTAEDQIPLYYDVYPGNRNDCPVFAEMVSRFRQFLNQMGWNFDVNTSLPITLIFDKGNNSADNIALLDRNNLHFIGSVKLCEHPDLTQISNKDKRFIECTHPELQGIRVLRFDKIKVYDKSRTVLLCYNPRLFEQQLLTLQADISKALSGLSNIRARLEDRANGLIKGGKAPTVDSIKKQVNTILRRQFLKDIIQIQIIEKPHLTLKYEYDTKKLDAISDTYLGKKIVITTRSEWDDQRIIKAYHDQYSIEHIFRNMKDRTTGVWWPMHHWTTQKICIHALYCTIATLLRALIHRRAKKALINIGYKRTFLELREIKEVLCTFKKSRRKMEAATMTVLSKRNEIQEQLLDIMGIPSVPQDVADILG
jgi:transposase